MRFVYFSRFFLNRNVLLQTQQQKSSEDVQLSSQPTERKQSIVYGNVFSSAITAPAASLKTENRSEIKQESIKNQLKEIISDIDRVLEKDDSKFGRSVAPAPVQLTSAPQTSYTSDYSSTVTPLPDGGTRTQTSESSTKTEITKTTTTRSILQPTAERYYPVSTHAWKSVLLSFSFKFLFHLVIITLLCYVIHMQTSITCGTITELKQQQILKSSKPISTENPIQLNECVYH